jgi:hypothetical protein
LEWKGYKLKVGTLKYNEAYPINETTKKFSLPAEDIIVTAEFEIDDGIDGSNWKYTYDDSRYYYVFTFKKPIFELYLDHGEHGTYTLKGTYSISGNIVTLTFNKDEPYGFGGAVREGVIAGNTLTIAKGTNSSGPEIYIKQE